MAGEPKNKNPRELLKKGLDELGFSYSEKQIAAFMTFLSELKKWTKAYNLTALKNDRDIIIRHFLDSLLFLKIIEEIASPRHVGARNESREVMKIADAGTGAGFPGIPLNIIKPGLDIALIESSRKKSAFLRHIIRLLELRGIYVLNSRIETIGKNYENGFDVIVSRATFKIKDFLKKACPYVKEDGWLVLSKGPKISEEIDFVGGLSRQDIMRKVVSLPFVHAGRTFMMFKCRK